MNFENKPNSKILRNNNANPTNINNNENRINPNLLKKKKTNITNTNEELKRELEEAENFLQKANKDFINFKLKEKSEPDNHSKMNACNNKMPVNDKEMLFLENTIKEIKRHNENKISLKQFLSENEKNLDQQKSDKLISIKYNNTNSNSNIPFSHNIIEATQLDLNQINQNQLFDSQISQVQDKLIIENENLLVTNRVTNNDDLQGKSFFQPDKNLMMRYRKQLKANGFPELGEIYVKSELDQDFLFKFLDFILIKKIHENGDKMRLKTNCEDLREKLNALQAENGRLQKENDFLKESSRKIDKESRFNNEKVGRIKDSFEKNIQDMKMEIAKLKHRLNNIQVEKKACEEKYAKMAENYQKIFTKLNLNNPNLKFFKPANIEIASVIKKNNIISILSKVNGTEKLIQTLKSGYNESLRELLFELSALKNFILEINNEIIDYASKINLKGMISLESNFVNMPFLDSIAKIKYALKTNIKLSFDFWNFDDIKQEQHDIDNICNIDKNSLNKIQVNSITDRQFSDKFEKNKLEAISFIREKCDSIFEIEKSEKNKDNSLVKHNKECNLFDQSNTYEHLIDFDLDNNFDLEISNPNNNSNKNIKRNTHNIANNSDINKREIIFENDLDIELKLKAESNKPHEYQHNKDDLYDKELEFLKQKWMKALNG